MWSSHTSPSPMDSTSERSLESFSLYLFGLRQSPSCSGQSPPGLSIFTSSINFFLHTDLILAIFCLQLPGESLFSSDYYSVILAWISQTRCKLFSVLISHSASLTRPLNLPRTRHAPHLAKSVSILDFTWKVFISFVFLSKSDLLLIHLNKNESFSSWIYRQNPLSL